MRSSADGDPRVVQGLCVCWGVGVFLLCRSLSVSVSSFSFVFSLSLSLCLFVSLSLSLFVSLCCLSTSNAGFHMGRARQNRAVISEGNSSTMNFKITRRASLEFIA